MTIYNSRLQKLQYHLEKLKGQQELLQDDLNFLKKEVRRKKRDLKNYEKAKEVVRDIGIQMQEKLQYHISDITSLALESVFDNPYTLEIEFVQRRNKTECDLYFCRNDSIIDPLSASGGGAIDVAAFALRIASCSLQNPKTRPVIILDEPMRFVSEDLRTAASAMIKEVSQKLGIQFIMITHDPNLTSYADKIYNVKIKNGISKVK